MIQTENAHGKAKRGRPPKVQAPEVSQAAPEGSSTPVTEPKKEGPFIFKSKFADDRITLKKPRKIKYDDGTMFVDPGVFAEFHYHTWMTDDPMLAEILRKKIEERKDVNPLNIVETTS